MPNWLRSGRSWARKVLRARSAHSAVRSTAERIADRRRRQRRADVQHHLDVAAEEHLRVDGPLGGEVVRTAVVGGGEGGALVVDAGPEREHLVAAGIGQDVAPPVGEAVEPAPAGDDLGAGPQHQVVGVAEDDLDPQALEVGRRQRAHRPAVPTGMKQGVRKVPRAVLTVPVRAVPRRASTLKSRATGLVDPHGSGHRRRLASPPDPSTDPRAPTTGSGRATWRHRRTGTDSRPRGRCRRGRPPGPDEGVDQHQQRRAGQVEVGQQHVHHATARDGG